MCHQFISRWSKYVGSWKFISSIMYVTCTFWWLTKCMNLRVVIGRDWTISGWFIFHGEAIRTKHSVINWFGILWQSSHVLSCDAMQCTLLRLVLDWMCLSDVCLRHFEVYGHCFSGHWDWILCRKGRTLCGWVGATWVSMHVHVPLYTWTQ